MKGLRISWLILAACLVGGCGEGRAPERVRQSGPMDQRAYVWQRLWSGEVIEAVRQHGGEFAGLTVLGAQLSWSREGGWRAVRPDLDWAALAATGKAVSVAVRVELPVPAGGVDGEVVREALRLAEAARGQGLELSELQVDFDSPQKRLGDYGEWLRAVVAAVKPLPVRITTLASWLGEPEFRTLVAACDGYVLQVHSFDPPAAGKRPVVCDPAKARAWVEQAGRLGVPFAVALPTYRSTAAYDPSGKKLGVATDGPAPAWPPGSVVYEFPADAPALAGLVAEWTASRPVEMRGLYWFRLPVASDVRNWRWPTLAAVMTGRPPDSRLEVKFAGGEPLDVVLSNTGEQDEWLPQSITLTWSGPAPAAGDGVGGWQLSADAGRAVFTTRAGRLLPLGATTALGWLRFHDHPPTASDIRIHLPSARPAPGER